jgi:RNA polymerase sigma factor (sigma-70 family)
MNRGSGLPGTVLEPRVSAGRAIAGLTDRELLGRFTAARDQDAFAALVERHGPMVLGVCRRVLRNSTDAQDAFQVTFLLLARRAAALASPERLAGWLHGVAYRTAAHLRARAARRKFHETLGATMRVPYQPDPEEREALAVLDEELNHLPEAYRTLLVLCYLEGKTHAQAAAALRCPVGSMSWRVARARRALHDRLTRRGVAVPAGLLVLLLTGQAVRAAPLPGEVVDSTARTATEYAAGSPAAAPPDQLSLTEELLARLPPRGRFGRVAALLLSLLLISGVFTGLAWGRSPQPEPTRTASPPGAVEHPPTGGGCGGKVPAGCSPAPESK